MRAQRRVALRGLTAPTHRRRRSSGRAGLPAQAAGPFAADASHSWDLTRRRQTSVNAYSSGGGILHRCYPENMPLWQRSIGIADHD